MNRFLKARIHTPPHPRGGGQAGRRLGGAQNPMLSSGSGDDVWEAIYKSYPLLVLLIWYDYL